MTRRRSQLRRKAPLSRRPPTRSKHTPSKPRRLPAPDREFWEEQRLILFGRSRGLCELGGCDLNDTGMEAHHRKLRSQGGGHGLTNLAALCPKHHRQCHDEPAWARMLGFIVPRAADPAARAVVLADGRTVRLTVEGGYDEVYPGPIDDTTEAAS